MSEIRVNNIVSEDGSAAPIYSQGVIVAAGKTLTCNGDFTVGSAVTFDQGAYVTGVVTFATGIDILSPGVEFSGVVTAATFSSGGLDVGGVNATGVVTASSFSGSLSLDNVTGFTSTGSGSLAFATSPTLVDPALGNASATSVNVSGAATVGGVLSGSSANFSGNVTVLGDLTYENVTNQDSIGIATARAGLRVTGGGLDVVGVATFNDNVKLLDSDKLLLGTSEDLEIYHDGSNSYIFDNGAGELRLNSGNAVRIRKHDNETMALFTVDGAAELYYDNSQKLATTGAGVTVTGGVEASGISTFVASATASMAQKSTKWTSGETATLNFTGGAGNVAYCDHVLNGNVTLAITNIPTNLPNHVLTHSVVIRQNAAARYVNALTYNGTTKTIHWQGAAAPDGNANRTDIFNFVGIDTVGDGAIASYMVLGNMNGEYGV
jgi:hypothetical protein